MSDPTVTVTLPAAAFDELLQMLDGYRATLTDSPPAWMDDDEQQAQWERAEQVRRLIATLRAAR